MKALSNCPLQLGATPPEQYLVLKNTWILMLVLTSPLTGGLWSLKPMPKIILFSFPFY